MMIAGIISARHGGASKILTGLIPITFPSTTGLVSESPTGKWGSGVSSLLSNLTLAASTAGTIQAEFQGATYVDVVLGFDSDNIVEPYGGYDNGIFVDSGSGNYAMIVAGTPTAATILVTATAGDLFRINVTSGGVMTAEYFRSAVWTVIYTFTSNTALKYIKANISAASRFLFNPQATGVN